MSGSKFLAPLLTRLEPLGFREPLDSKLNFKLDALIAPNELFANCLRFACRTSSRFPLFSWRTG